MRYWAGILALGMTGAGPLLARARTSFQATAPTKEPTTEQMSAQTSVQTSDQKAAPTGATYQPKYPGDPARSESEALALGYMRVVLRAQREYKKRHDKFAESLEALAGTGSFTKRMAHSTDRGDYTASFRSHRDGFVLTMTPNHLDSEHRSFYAEDDGVIHADDQKAADMDSPKVK
jgi:hypothetical protein